MGSRKEYLKFILAQLSDLEEVSYRAMMGEFSMNYPMRGQRKCCWSMKWTVRNF